MLTSDQIVTFIVFLETQSDAAKTLKQNIRMLACCTLFFRFFSEVKDATNNQKTNVDKNDNVIVIFNHRNLRKKILVIVK